MPEPILPAPVLPTPLALAAVTLAMQHPLTRRWDTDTVGGGELLSYIVAVGLPVARGMNTEALVSMRLGWALGTYAGLLLPAFLHSMLKLSVLDGIRIYKTRVKLKISGQ